MKSVKLDTTSDLCSIYLFRNVTNSSEIKSKLINGEIDVTVLNAALITCIDGKTSICFPSQLTYHCSNQISAKECALTKPDLKSGS